MPEFKLQMKQKKTSGITLSTKQRNTKNEQKQDFKIWNLVKRIGLFKPKKSLKIQPPTKNIMKRGLYSQNNVSGSHVKKINRTQKMWKIVFYIIPRIFNVNITIP